MRWWLLLALTGCFEDIGSGSRPRVVAEVSVDIERTGMATIGAKLNFLPEDVEVWVANGAERKLLEYQDGELFAQMPMSAPTIDVTFFDGYDTIAESIEMPSLVTLVKPINFDTFSIFSDRTIDMEWINAGDAGYPGWMLNTTPYCPSSFDRGVAFVPEPVPAPTTASIPIDDFANNCFMAFVEVYRRSGGSNTGEFGSLGVYARAYDRVEVQIFN